MKHNGEVLSTVSTLTSGAVFSIAYVSAVLLVTSYFNQLYNIGKYEIWPFAVSLVIGEFIKTFIINAKRDSVSKRNKSFKLKTTKVKHFIKSLFILLASLIIYYIIAVLFGAPVFSEHEETFMFSLLLTILTVLPLLLNLGADITIAVLGSITAYDGLALSQIMINCLRLTLFGAWLGAVVIPLDWDRPWQVWPIPCSFGALCGYIVSQFYVLLLNLPEIASLLSKKTGKYGL